MVQEVSATQFLRESHRTLLGLFRQYNAVDERAHELREGTIREILGNIEVHSKIEEETFYPALAGIPDEVTQSVIADCLEDHDVIRALLDQAKGMMPPSEGVRGEDFEDIFDELIETVQEHIEIEESELFPDVELYARQANQSLGEEMVRNKPAA